MASRNIKIEDNKLIRQIVKGNNEALIELAGRHSPLVNKVINGFSPKLSAAGFFADDYRADVNSIIYDACLKFNPRRKMKFSSYLYSMVRFKFMNLLRKKTLNIYRPPITNLFQRDESVEVTNYQNTNIPIFRADDVTFDVETSKDFYTKCFSVLEELDDKRVKEVWLKRIEEDKSTWNGISGSLNPPVSYQTGINLFNKGKEYILNHPEIQELIEENKE